MANNIQGMLDEMLPQLPVFITRADVPKYFGSVISKGYLANLDSVGAGPRRIVSGNLRGKAIYRTEDFVRWLFKRMEYAYEGDAACAEEEVKSA